MSRLRVMLVDESRERSVGVAEQLQSAQCEVVACLSPADDLLEEMARARPDVVIIDIDLPGRDTLESLRSVQDTAPRPMVMFSQDDNGDTIRRAVQAGVSAYVVDGVQAQRVRPILEAAIARFEQHRSLRDELEQARSQLVERKTIERAKGIVMRQRGLDEGAAYQLMRRTAMDQNRRLVEIAESIISAAELLAGPGPASRPRDTGS